MVKELFEKDFNLSALNFSSLLSESTFCTTAQDAGHLAASSSQVDDTATSQGYVSLLHNHERALRDIATLRKAVRQRDTACLLAEQELLCVRSNAQEAIAETRALRARVRMSEAAAAQARHVETDYDQVVSLLESELAKLASQNPNRKQAGQRDQPFTAPPSELSDILALLQRKEESKSNYAAALDILLQFVYELQKVLSSLGGRNGTALRPSQGMQDENKGGDVSQASLARHRNAVSFLTMRAKETLTQIRASLKDETLPLVFSDKPSLDVSTASRKQTTLNASVTRPCVQLSPVLELQGSIAGTSGMSV
ncbi:PREDICTED: syntaxin-binding protein 4-like [Priapulus caudatus]|uniref:Syntaxin-binding protein 4-like n=1 Tax=Priapulus caudatus TaxID=37621 RepID=A0ABM1EYN6_PRICU|nr:PREDICTED: syntaxin-binding protein 4-like [Priapulus caudatus]